MATHSSDSPRAAEMTSRPRLRMGSPELSARISAARKLWWASHPEERVSFGRKSSDCMLRWWDDPLNYAVACAENRKRSAGSARARAVDLYRQGLDDEAVREAIRGLLGSRNSLNVTLCLARKVARNEP